MKMDQIRLIGAQTVNLPIASVDEAGPFMLKSVEGLGPPDITVRMAQTVEEKASYQGKRAAFRQIISLIGLQPNWDENQTPEELRSQLYSLLTPRGAGMVTCNIVYQNVVQATAVGQISKLETSMFTADPAVQITLDCDYPYLLAPVDKIQTPAITTLQDQLRSFLVSNPGNAPAGFKMGIVLNNDLVSDWLMITDGDALGKQMIIDGIDWKAGDKFILDTRPGSKGVWRIAASGGGLVSVLNNVNYDVSEWLTLYAGDNTLNVAADYHFDPAYNFVHRPAYWGV